MSDMRPSETDSILPPPSPVGSALEVNGRPAAPPPPRAIVKVLVGGLLLLVVTAGVTVFLMSRGGGEVRAQAEAFVRDLAAGNFEAAKARCTPDTDFDQLRRDVKRIQGCGALRDISLPAVTTKTMPSGQMRSDIALRTEFENITLSFSGTLVEQSDKTYLIAAYRFE